MKWGKPRWVLKRAARTIGDLSPLHIGRWTFGTHVGIGTNSLSFRTVHPLLFLRRFGILRLHRCRTRRLQWLRLFCLRLVHLCVFRRLLPCTSHPHPQTNHMSSDGHPVQVYRFYMTQGTNSTLKMQKPSLPP